MEMNPMVSPDHQMDSMGAYGMGGPPGMTAPTSNLTPNPMMNQGYAGPMSGMNPGMNPGIQMQRMQKVPGHLSNVQMKLLTAQIKAYRYLARNVPLPDQLKAIIFSHASSVSGRITPTSSPSSIPPENSSFQSPPLGKQSPLTSATKSYQQPQSGTPPTSQATNQSTDKPGQDEGKTGKTSENKGQGQLKPVKLAPVSKPQGIDPEIIIKEREARYVVQGHIQLIILIIIGLRLGLFIVLMN